MSLEVISASVRFGGIVALNDVSLTVEKGHIFGVIGPNGSGKSTLFNAVSGMVTLQSGKVVVDGTDLAGMPPHRRVAAGLARTFQTPRFDPGLSVVETVLCGFYPVRQSGLIKVLFRPPSVAREEAHLLEEAHTILRILGLEAYSNTTMGELPMGHIRLVEVARAVANKPRYILLDEPAAGLTRDEQRTLAAQIRKLAESGVGVMLIEHNFALVQNLAEEILVLDRGRQLIRGLPDEIVKDEQFLKAYLGEGTKVRLREQS